MSMISGLVDELNKSADEWNASNMFELARMCREAADTIWQLRDDLQRANDAAQDAEHEGSMAWDRVRKAERENAKLRELAADMLRAMRRMEASAGMDALVGHSAWFAPKLHELGIEVD